MQFLLAWIEARKIIALKKLEMEQERRERRRKELDEKKRYKMKKDKFAIIYQFEEDWSGITRLSTKTKFKIYYCLMENEFGERKCEVDSDHVGRLGDTNYARSDIYISKVKPWINGAYIEEYPSYDTVKKDELAHRLKNG